MVMGWALRGAKMATVPVGKFRRCVWTGSVASVVMAVMVRLIVSSSFLPVFLRYPGVRAVGCFVCDVYHMLCPGFAFRAFLASTAHLSCGMIGGRQEKTDTKK